MVDKSLTATDSLPAEARAPIPRGQKTFHALVEKIKARRAKLAEWEAYGEEFNRKYSGEFVPLRRKLDEVRTQLLVSLDQSHDQKGLTKAERGIVADLIVHIADQVLMSGPDPVVAEIHERYNPADPEAEAAVREEIKNTLREEFAFDIPEGIDMSSPDELMRFIQAQLDAQEQRDEQHGKAGEQHQARRKRAAEQAKAEERARAEEAKIHMPLREIYRKLVSALHPDREADPVERERKAVLMQRVNKAYANRSLLELLELQLELEHIDQAALNSTGAERLKHWNAVLKEQLHGLDLELVEVDSDFQMRCGMYPVGPTSPKIIKRRLSEYTADLRALIQAFEDDLRVFDDIKRLKPWLKAMKWNLKTLD
ncbi:hypothetical protein KPL74_16545 [Bacillus sp. NP157]|nr:hypothetical protein KPL74_16545 [Bacillus sp. NP157]